MHTTTRLGPQTCHGIFLRPVLKAPTFADGVMTEVNESCVYHSLADGTNGGERRDGRATIMGGGSPYECGQHQQGQTLLQFTMAHYDTSVYKYSYVDFALLL
ncbi:hypothetical protein ANO14919_023010 [Xylariales sp. No.14919]|nr:hypothetical protein ANO14919_023010 [Xylariales sp. No.14919]